MYSMQAVIRFRIGGLKQPAKLIVGVPNLPVNKKEPLTRKAVLF